MKITYGKLTKEVAEAAGLTEGEAYKALEALESRLLFHTDGGEEVAMGTLGKFVIRSRTVKSKRNPRTGEVVQVEPYVTKRLDFIQGKNTKARLND